LDFENAIKANPEQKMPLSAFGCSFSRQHYLLFRCLGLFVAIHHHDVDGVAMQYLPGRRNSV
jgi:hypothetical protein